MFEYKNEIIKTYGRIVSKKLKNSEICELEELDTIVNERASEGWELVSHSMAIDSSLANHNILLTYKRQKG